MAASAQGGTRRPTLHDVAQQAGVSIKTASRVVNNVTTVDAALTERVREAISRLGYRPNQLASTLKSGAATSMIGLVLKDISNEFYASIALGVSSVASARTTQLITAASDEDIDSEQELGLIFDLCRRRVDGMIIIPRGGDYAALRTEIDMGTPMVFLDREADGLVADSVLLDNAGGARAAATRLAELGHRRVGLVIHSLDLEPVRARYDGFLEGLSAARIEVEPELVLTDVFDPEAARRAADRLLDLADPPTAIFTVNNRLTEGVITAVWARGADTMVAGFDDFRFSGLVPVPLLLVAYDAREYGRVAAERLFARIDGDDSAAQHVVIPTHLIETGRRPGA